MQLKYASNKARNYYVALGRDLKQLARPASVNVSILRAGVVIKPFAPGWLVTDYLAVTPIIKIDDGQVSFFSKKLADRYKLEKRCKLGYAITHLPSGLDLLSVLSVRDGAKLTAHQAGLIALMVGSNQSIDWSTDPVINGKLRDFECEQIKAAIKTSYEALRDGVLPTSPQVSKE